MLLTCAKAVDCTPGPLMALFGRQVIDTEPVYPLWHVYVVTLFTIVTFAGVPAFAGTAGALDVSQ